jgi:hypothetical protein
MDDAAACIQALGPRTILMMDLESDVSFKKFIWQILSSPCAVSVIRTSAHRHGSQGQHQARNEIAIILILYYT